MANSTTNIDTVVQSQASKEVTINAFFDAASPATLYGRRASTTVGLTWGYYGGNVTKGDGTLAQIANGTVGLSASTTNYIVAAKSGGAVTAATATTNWNDTTNYWRLYSVVTGTATITSYTDSRELGKMTGGGGTGSAITAKDEGSNLTTALTSVDFVGAGVTATNTGGAVTVTIPGSSGITVKDDGSNLTTALTSLDFTGGGVTATNTGGAVTVAITGSASITAKDEGTNLTTTLASVDFVGAGVTATTSGDNVTVTIPGGSSVTVKDDGSNLTTALTSLDFTGGGVTATNTGGAVTVAIAGSASITAKDEGTNLTTTLASVDFVGAGVTATTSGDNVTVTIPGGSSVTVKDEGTNLTTSLTSMDFVGAGVTATNTGGAVTVTIPTGGREVLSANRTYYVRTDGSDSNNGLANTSGGAFLTIQKAADVITETLDLASYTATVQVADGTYTSGVTLRKCHGRGGYGVAVLQGNSGTPANVVISATSANAILSTANANEWLVKDLKVQTTTSGHGIYASVNAYISFENIVFGACATSQVYAAYGGTAAASGNYSITGGAPYHWIVALGGRIVVSGKTITLTGTPAYSTGFAAASHCGVVSCSSNTFNGSATGKRYTNIVSNGIVDTGGGGASYLPGGTAGDAPTTGGQYL